MHPTEDHSGECCPPRARLRAPTPCVFLNAFCMLVCVLIHTINQFQNAFCLYSTHEKKPYWTARIEKLILKDLLSHDVLSFFVAASDASTERSQFEIEQNLASVCN
eukprot:g15237.t1